MRAVVQERTRKRRLHKKKQELGPGDGSCNLVPVGKIGFKVF